MRIHLLVSRFIVLALGLTALLVLPPPAVAIMEPPLFHTTQPCDFNWGAQPPDIEGYTPSAFSSDHVQKDCSFFPEARYPEDPGGDSRFTRYIDNAVVHCLPNPAVFAAKITKRGFWQRLLKRKFEGDLNVSIENLTNWAIPNSKLSGSPQGAALSSYFGESRANYSGLCRNQNLTTELECQLFYNDALISSSGLIQTNVMVSNTLQRMFAVRQTFQQNQNRCFDTVFPCSSPAIAVPEGTYCDHSLDLQDQTTLNLCRTYAVNDANVTNDDYFSTWIPTEDDELTFEEFASSPLFTPEGREQFLSLNPNIALLPGYIVITPHQDLVRVCDANGNNCSYQTADGLITNIKILPQVVKFYLPGLVGTLEEKFDQLCFQSDLEQCTQTIEDIQRSTYQRLDIIDLSGVIKDHAKFPPPYSNASYDWILSKINRSGLICGSAPPETAEFSIGTTDPGPTKGFIFNIIHAISSAFKGQRNVQYYTGYIVVPGETYQLAQVTGQSTDAIIKRFFPLDQLEQDILGDEPVRVPQSFGRLEGHVQSESADDTDPAPGVTPGQVSASFNGSQDAVSFFNGGEMLDLRMKVGQSLFLPLDDPNVVRSCWAPNVSRSAGNYLGSIVNQAEVNYYSQFCPKEKCVPYSTYTASTCAPPNNCNIPGHQPFSGNLDLFTFDHDTDTAPQLNTLIAGQSRLPVNTLYQTDPPTPRPIDLPADRDFATIVGFGVADSLPVLVPRYDGQDIGGGYEVLVLYASATGITLKYTGEDDIVSGYTLHLDNLSVDPEIVNLYNQLNQEAETSQTPRKVIALCAGMQIGTTIAPEIKVAIRDTGSLMDPRWENDWWSGTNTAQPAACTPAVVPALTTKNICAPEPTAGPTQPYDPAICNVDFKACRLCYNGPGTMGDVWLEWKTEGPPSQTVGHQGPNNLNTGDCLDAGPAPGGAGWFCHWNSNSPCGGGRITL